MKVHPEVIHANEFLKKEEGFVAKINVWLASHLAWLFGLVWTIWVFFLYPLVLLSFPQNIQDKGFFLSSGWIQLWALPLFVYVGNRLQKSTDAQSDSMTRALTHIAIVEDQNAELIKEIKELIATNNQLTEEIHKVTNQKEKGTEIHKDV